MGRTRSTIVGLDQTQPKIQNGVKQYTRGNRKNFKHAFFYGPNPAHHYWAGPESTQDPWSWLSPAHISWLLCMSTVTSFTVREETKAKGRRVYLEKPRSSVTARDGSGSRRWRKWFTVAGDAVFLLSLSSVFCSLLCYIFFFFFQPSPSLFSSFSSLLCPLSSIFSPFSRPPFLFFPPIFIGKNRGGTWPGQPLCCRPSNTWKVLGCVGIFLMLFRRRKSVKHEEENLLLPLPGASRGRRRHMMSFKTAPFLLYFLKKTKKYETTSLFPKRVVSFKWELAPKRVRFKTRP